MPELARIILYLGIRDSIRPDNADQQAIELLISILRQWAAPTGMTDNPYALIGE